MSMITSARAVAGGALLTVLAVAGGVVPCDAAEPAAGTFEVMIAGGRVAAPMKVIKVEQGDRVRLLFTSDTPMTLHLHGYDVEIEVTPGAPAELSFEAYAAGRYAVEEHGRGGAHGEALLRIEVHPR